MLIDDEDIDLRMYRRVIDRAGFSGAVHTFADAELALAFLKNPINREIDLLFLDIRMPRMNGFEFLEAVVSDIGDAFASIVVVMLTTSISPDDHDRAMSTGIVRAYIDKPLKPEDVRYAIRLAEGRAA